MNPLTNMKNVLKLSEQELRSSMKTSWHDQYKHSAWIYVGGLPFDLTEGDVICVFSQYGEVVNINLVRDKGTGKSRGFCFICYQDQRSTNLAVDNFNGIKLLNRIIRVDHCEAYKAPKDDKMDEETRQLHSEGCAPGSKFGNLPQLPSSSNNGGLDKGLNLPPMGSLLNIKTEKDDVKNKGERQKKSVKEKKTKKAKEEIRKIFKRKKDKVKNDASSLDSEDSSSDSDEKSSRRRKLQKKSKQRESSTHSSSSSDNSESDDRSKSVKSKEVIIHTKSRDFESSGEKASNKQLYRSNSPLKRSQKSNSPGRGNVWDKTSKKRYSNEDVSLSRHHSRTQTLRCSDEHPNDSLSFHRSKKSVDQGESQWSQRERENKRGRTYDQRDDKSYNRERNGHGYRKYDK